MSPGDSDEVKLQKLYTRVQKLKNSTFEVAKTEEEKKREKEKNAPNAEDVLKQGYGTRTQLNWLYLALVRAGRFRVVWSLGVGPPKLYFQSSINGRRTLGSQSRASEIGWQGLVFRARCRVHPLRNAGLG